jgi:predicted MFS family arabinose efflux permease
MPGIVTVETPAVGRRAAFASLRNRQYRWLYGSNLAFFFAMNGQFVVRSYLAYRITGSALALGLINLAVAVPMLLVSPLGGVIADRVEKRRLVMGGQLVLILNEAAVLVLLVTGHLQFWHLMAVVFVMGCTFPFIMPARQAIVVSIVGRQGLANAMALGMGAMNAARVVAPAAAGFLIYLLGVRSTYMVAIAVYAIALLAMTRVNRSPPAAREKATTMYADILEGFKYVRDDPPVRVLMLLGVVPIVLAMPFQALLVVFAVDVWDVGSRGLGLLQAAAGLGGLAGAFYLAWWGEGHSRLRVMMTSLLGFGASLFLFAASPIFALGLVMVLVADVFASVFQTLNNTVVQLLIPDHVRGRVLSLMMMSFGLTPLGTVPISAIAEAFGAPVAVGSAAAVMVLVAVLFYVLSPSLRDINRITHQAVVSPPGDEPGPAAGRPLGEAPAAP